MCDAWNTQNEYAAHVFWRQFHFAVGAIEFDSNLIQIRFEFALNRKYTNENDDFVQFLFGMLFIFYFALNSNEQFNFQV